MNNSKLFTMPNKSKTSSKSKQRSTKSTVKISSTSMAKQWLMRFSEKHSGSDEQFERWINK